MAIPLLFLALVALLRLLLAWRQARALALQPDSGYARALLAVRGLQQGWQLAWAALVVLAASAWAEAVATPDARLLLAASLLAGWCWEIPARALKPFVADARHGRNRLGPGAFLREQAIGLLQFAALALPGAFVAPMLLARFGAAGWLLIAAVGWLGHLALRELKPRLQSRRVDRLEPLPAGPLRARLEQALARLGVGHAQLLQLSVAGRSAQANAQARGTRRRPQIVLHDTLIAQLPAEEVEAVAVHELGHVLLGHLRVQRLLFGLAALPLVLLAGALSATLPELALRLAVAWALWPSLWLFALPLVHGCYRRWEFEADAVAARGASATAMAAALRRLSAHNANLPPPDRWYEWVYHSHPAIAARLAALAEPSR